MEAVTDFLFLCSKITADGDCSHGIRRWTFGRKAMTNQDSVLNSKDITLPTKVCIVNPMVFPVVMYGSENWTIRKAVHAKSLQSHPLCNTTDCSLSGSSVHGIFQARILEWVAISFSGRSSQPGDQTLVSYVSCTGRHVLFHKHHLGGGAGKECWRMDVFKLWSWRRLLRVHWTARESNQSILKEINYEYSLEGLMLKLKLQ